MKLRTGHVDQDVLEIDVWIVAVELRGLDEAHDRCRALAREQGASEEPVLPPRGPRPNMLLVEIVVDRKCRVVQVSSERALAMNVVAFAVAVAVAVVRGRLSARPQCSGSCRLMHGEKDAVRCKAGPSL